MQLISYEILRYLDEIYDILCEDLNRNCFLFTYSMQGYLIGMEEIPAIDIEMYVQQEISENVKQM